MQLMRMCLLLALVACGTALDDTAVDTDTAGDSDTEVVDTEVADTEVEPLVCASAELGTALGSLGQWDGVASCGHFYFGAVQAGANRAISLSLLADREGYAVDDVVSVDFARPGAAVASLVVAVGLDLQPVCALPGDDTAAPVPTIARSWSAVAGTLSFTITEAGPVTDGVQALQATVALTDVVLESVDAKADRCPVPDASWSARDFGPLPSAQ